MECFESGRNYEGPTKTPGNHKLPQCIMLKKTLLLKKKDYSEMKRFTVQ